jgi:ElaB/YqjD/DUF883 family membrane-anchored ribosome-binding protein
MNDDALTRLADELRRVLAELDESLRQGLEAGGETPEGAACGWRTTLQRARERLRAVEQQLADRAGRVNEAVRAHPWESIAVAGVAGFLLGKLGRRP